MNVPVIAAVVGEGGSGGAIALAVGDRVLMMEHAVYSVISPEGCASILWRNASRARDAAEALRLTAADLSELGVVDRIVSEPLGGAHRQPVGAINALGEAIAEALDELTEDDTVNLRHMRREKIPGNGSGGSSLGGDGPSPRPAAICLVAAARLLPTSKTEEPR